MWTQQEVREAKAAKLEIVVVETLDRKYQEQAEGVARWVR